MAALTPNLLQAYRATSYETDGPPKFILHVGRRCPMLDTYLIERGLNSWAFLTAENPRSSLLSVTENEARNAQLAVLIKRQGYPYLPGKGIPATADWLPEHSFLMLGIAKATATELARQFDQNAYVYGRVGEAAELVWVEYAQG